MNGHYHIIENTPGYLPDTEPACFASKREAQSYALSLARELRDEGYHVDGSAGDYWVPDYHALGRVICTEPIAEPITDCNGE